MSNPQRAWSNCLTHDDRQKPIYYHVEIDWHQLHVMARKAMKSKGKQSHDGPVKVVIAERSIRDTAEFTECHGKIVKT